MPLNFVAFGCSAEAVSKSGQRCLRIDSWRKFLKAMVFPFIRQPCSTRHLEEGGSVRRFGISLAIAEMQQEEQRRNFLKSGA
jgi:hypothetical protein